jgi:hypothetical protein
MASQTLWHRSPDSVLYTTPRQYTIERLPNGKFRVFHYGPGLSSLHDSLAEAYRHCGVRSPFYAVTVVDANDPESTRTLTMSENEVRDTYQHWGGKRILTARDGSTVRIEASL